MASALDNFRSPSALARFLVTAMVGVSLDLWTKHLAFAKLAIGSAFTLPGGAIRVYSKQPYELIPGWLQFEVMPNQGAVFGLGQGMRTLFIFVSIAAIIFLVYLFATSGRRRAYQIVLGLLLAGVLGNMYDRVELGYVRDMIHALPRWKNFFPYVFNVADSLLCIGVGLMIIFSLLPAQWRGSWDEPVKNEPSIPQS